MFTCFWRPWVETCHCAELPFFSLDWRASNWSNRTELFFRAFLVSSIVVTHWSLWSGTTSFGHCGELWQLGKLVLVDRALDMRGELSNTRFQLTSHCQTFHCSVTHCWWQTHFVWTNCTGRAAALMTLYYSRRRRTSLPVMKMIILISLVKSMWKSLDFQSALMAWLSLSLAAIEIEIGTVIFWCTDWTCFQL